MKKKPFCGLCKCDNHDDMGPAGRGDNSNWHCPLLNTNICYVDCEIELEGGMGAPDTLAHVCKKTGKTPQEVHATCVACPHGGKKLERSPKLISVRGKDGTQVSSGPEFDRALKETKDEWNREIRFLQGKKK